MRNLVMAVCATVFLCASLCSMAEEDLKVLPKTIDGVAPHEMMSQYLLRQIDEAWERWQQAFDECKTPEQIAAYQQRLRERFIEALGGFPERTPLNPHVTGIIQRQGYRIEKVIFESQPKHYVTAVLFVPESDAFTPPHPGVLVPCGHSANGKAYDTYESMGASLALHGMVALVFDPIEQGERYQLLNDEGKPIIGGTLAHTMVGIGSMLVGRNTARFEIWDGMRAIDYLESRPEVDPEWIGCTGNSGGGTQTSYLMALDDRIKVAAPSCYLNRQGRQLRTATGDAEQNIFGQLAFGMDHPDYLMMRAPIPILICAATKDFFDINATWESFRCAKRLYSRMGCPERISLLENDAEHNYNKLQRTGVLRWMARWLLGKDEPLTEPDIELLGDEEIQCTPRGQVMLMEDARTTYDLNEDHENKLAEQRKALWATTDRTELLDRVRQIAGIRALDNLPKPEVQAVGEVARHGCRIEKLILEPEHGIYLPALLFVPEDAQPGSVVLYLHEKGKEAHAASGGPIDGLVRDGAVVLAVDLRGTGETQQATQTQFGAAIGLDWEDVYKAYVLGRSYVGMRAEDVLVSARYLRDRYSRGVQLTAVGSVGVPALHAAALGPALFSSVKLVRTLGSWSNVVHARRTHNQLANAVHGALRAYDLPDLAETLGDDLTIEQPVDASGRE